MEDSFDALEEKVRKAAELVRRLRKENVELEKSLAESRSRLTDAERRLSELERTTGASAAQAQQIDGLNREMKTLRQEREEVRQRIAKLLHVLETIDS
jgi:predicted RNase H-like nuclease (RuvC/YqgF family)